MSEVLIVVAVIAFIILALLSPRTVEKKKKEKHKWVIRTISDTKWYFSELIELEYNPGLCKGDEVSSLDLIEYVVEYSYYDMRINETLIMVRKKEK